MNFDVDTWLQRHVGALELGAPVVVLGVGDASLDLAVVYEHI